MIKTASLSIKHKILLLVGLIVCSLSVISIFVIYRNNNNLLDQIDDALMQGNRHVVNGVIKGQDKRLEKLLLNVIGTNELVSFLTNPNDVKAQQVLAGMFITLKAENVVRFSIYDKNLETVLQMPQGKTSAAHTVPDTLRSLFRESEKDLSNRYYPWRVEGSDNTSSVEYCGMTTVTDRKDQPVGFVELALKPNPWVSEVASQAGCAAGLFDQTRHVFACSTDASLYEDLHKGGFQLTADQKTVITSVKSIHFHSTLIPLLDPGQRPAAYLVLTKDHTAQINRQRKDFLLGIGACSVLAVLGGLLGLRIVLSFTRPLDQVVGALNEMAQSDLTARIPDTLLARKDEIGSLANALGTVTVNLRGILRNVVGGMQTLAASSAEMSQISYQLAEGAERNLSKSSAVAAAAEQMSDNTSLVADRMKETTANLATVAAATEEMSATIGEIAVSSEKARSMSQEATEEVRVITDLMQELGGAAAEIGRVTDAITSISSQTNLLALNAAIEAARAGTAGKGFAVVANEIKALAGQTAYATEDIRNRITAIQASTHAAVENVGRIATVISKVSTIVVQIASAIEEQASVTREMAQDISNTSFRVQDANDLVAQTAQVAHSIALDISSVNTASVEMTTASQQVQANVQELSRLAVQIMAMVSRFKLEKEGAAGGKAASAPFVVSDNGRPFMEWSEDLSVGVAGMDEQHRKFLVMLNELHQSMKQGRGGEVIRGILKDLVQYTQYHFAAEEAYMAQQSYPDLARHKEAHKRFVGTLADYQRRTVNGDSAVVIEAMNAVRDWLLQHIQKVDKQYGLRA